MNNLDKSYTDLLQDILDNGVTKDDRTGTGTISVFGRQIRHKMSDGFPLITTKRIPFRLVVTELLWFLRGDTSIEYLLKNDCNIWTGDAYKNYIFNSEWFPISSVTGGFIGTKSDSDEIMTQDLFINKIKTDDEFAKKWGDLGPVYGKQWRSWGPMMRDIIPLETGGYVYKGPIDQIANLINDLKTNPDSRRLMVNAWNVGELDQMVLPPCHYGFQLYTRELTERERNSHSIACDVRGQFRTMFSEEELNEFNVPKRVISLMFNMRSTDVGLGLGFNLASYGLLLMMIAKQVNMVPNELIYNGGDVHLYSNHIEQAKEQIGREMNHDEKVKYARSLYGDKDWWNINDDRVLEILHSNKRTREPYPLPTVKLSDRVVNDISEYTLDDIVLENYQSHPSIKMPLSN
jgi:thymidylate synthase